MSIEVIAIFTQTDGMVIPGTSPVNVTLPFLWEEPRSRRRCCSRPLA